MIGKTACDAANLYRPSLLYPNARSAFRAFLQAAGVSDTQCVLLPAFVGWSSREGSGVFDPIQELGLSYQFYRVDDQLRIDLEHLKQCLQRLDTRVLVLIHYFGYVDPGYEKAVAFARDRGILVLEDEAHALLTDVIGGASGRLGDACIYSTHKLLPVEGGGVLRFSPRGLPIRERVRDSDSCEWTPPWAYDLFGIARRRQENARLLSALLVPLKGEVDPLWASPGDGEIPQTYPVVIRHVSRDRLYHVMNEAGFGVVSLYHTLVSPIDPESFPESHYLAKRIMNLPVHQDATADHIQEMVEYLARCVSSLGE